MTIIADLLKDIIDQIQDTKYVLCRVSRQPLPVECNDRIKKAVKVLGKANQELNELQKDMSGDEGHSPSS